MIRAGHLLADLSAGAAKESVDSAGAAKESVDVLARGEGVRIERIVSRGHRSPEGFWFDQDEDEWVLLVAGAAVLETAEGRRVSLGPGDWVHLPAHERHRVHWTDPDCNTIWLAVFSKPEVRLTGTPESDARTRTSD